MGLADEPGLERRRAEGQQMDVGLPKLKRNRLAKQEQESLGGVVGAHVGPRVEAGYRGDVDDVPLVGFQHVGEEDAGQVQRRVAVDLGHVQLLGDGHVDEVAAVPEPGAVDEDVHEVPRFLAGGEDLLEVIALGEVGRQDVDAFTQLFLGLIQAGFVFVDEQQMMAAGLINGGEGPPKPRGGSGDQSYFFHSQRMINPYSAVIKKQKENPDCSGNFNVDPMSRTH